MADTRQMKRSMRQLNRIKLWHLIVALVVLMVISATFLRLNNVGMAERRRAVIAADKTGDMAQIRQRLADLQRYTAAHMNTETGPIYLQEQYNRDAKTALKAVQTSSSAETANAKADAVCKPRFSSWSIAYVQCVYEELGKLTSSDASIQKTAKLPDTSLYYYTFNAPLWSADVAGWSVLLTLIVLLCIVVRLAGIGILRILLHLRYRSV